MVPQENRPQGPDSRAAALRWGLTFGVYDVAAVIGTRGLVVVLDECHPSNTAGGDVCLSGSESLLLCSDRLA